MNLVGESIPETEMACVELLKAARWPEGYRCPRCSCADYYEISGRRLPLYECVSCRYQCSVITGTILERSRVSLRKWFHAIAIMADSGMNAKRLSRLIDVTYKTAWLMMHKLRDAMASHNDDHLLTGLVRLETGMTSRQMIPKLNGLHPSETPFIIGGAIDGEGNVRRVAVKLDTGGDTYRGQLTAQGAEVFVERCVDLNRAIVDITERDWRMRAACPLRVIRASIEQESKRYNGWCWKNRIYYVQEAVYRTNLRLAEAKPFRALLELVSSTPAPTLDAVKDRLVPERPDWSAEREHRYREAELKAYASSLLARAAMALNSAS